MDLSVCSFNDHFTTVYGSNVSAGRLFHITLSCSPALGGAFKPSYRRCINVLNNVRKGSLSHNDGPRGHWHLGLFLCLLSLQEVLSQVAMFVYSDMITVLARVLGTPSDIPKHIVLVTLSVGKIPLLDEC